MSKVLFLCSGNYYRSRFAEHLFNHLAQEKRLNWHAESRALSTEIGPWKKGPISEYAREGLHVRGVAIVEPAREPLYCCEDDLKQAKVVIALKEAEHRPLIESKFEGWEDRVEYWHIHDIDKAHPTEALKELDELVRQLIARLSTKSR